MKYFTMVDMAKIIGIPESTARGYRDRFPSYLTTTGHGRSKRYTEKALEALRIVAGMVREGIPFNDIETALEARFGVAVESRESHNDSQESQQWNIVPQPYLIASTLTPEELAELFKQGMQEAMKPLQEQNEAIKKEMEGLKAELKAIEERQEIKAENHFDLVDRRLKEIVEESKKSFWAKLFKK